MRYTPRGLSSMIKLRATKISRSFLSWQVRSLIGYKFALKMEQTAVIKEALRIAVATPAGLPRIVPPSGAVISGVNIPGGVRVSCPSIIESHLKP